MELRSEAVPSQSTTPSPRPVRAVRRVAAGLAVSMAMLTGACATPQPRLLLLQTTSGAFAGAHTRTATAYLGVPYAEPPLGPLRWREPAPAPRAAAVRAAHAWPADVEPEDCLRVDLWLPRGVPADGAPLLVWLVDGPRAATELVGTTGARLADRGVAVAHVHLRTGLLGTFAHPALELQRPGGPCNFALLDALQALRWLRDNAPALGVDPERVTLAAAGRVAGLAVHLWAAPDARGLFQRVMLHDADGFAEPAPARLAREEGQRLLSLAGLVPATTAADLRALPATRLLAVDPAGGPLAHPVRDDALAPAAPWLRLARGDEAAVPLLVGSTDRGAPDDARRAAAARGIAALHCQRAPCWLFRYAFAPDGTAVPAPADLLFSPLPRTSATAAAAARRWMEEHVLTYWAAFAAGAPLRSAGAPDWPPYEPRNDGDVTLRFGPAIEVRVGLDRAALDRALEEFARETLTR
ncbi:MAG: carboxylesterase family protein [Planctomycetota bacterium]